MPFCSPRGRGAVDAHSSAAGGALLLDHARCGLERGEATEAGLRRELREELGLPSFVLGPLLWLRQHTFDWAGRRICPPERYYIVHVERFAPKMSDVVEARVLQSFR